MSRVCIAALVFLLLIDARPVFAVGGGGGLGLVWVEPVGGFRETADPSAAISMWGAIGPRFSPWRLRFEWHFIEEHEVAGFPDPLYVPYPGLTGPNTVWVYTEVNGVTIGPMLDSHLGRLPALAWLAIGFDDFEPSYGTSYMGAPNTFGDEPGAPGGFCFSVAIGGAIRLFESHQAGKVGGFDIGAEFLAHPNASYLDRPAVDESGAWRTVNGPAHMVRFSVGFGMRSHPRGADHRAGE